jgi:hypothetical protein
MRRQRRGDLGLGEDSQHYAENEIGESILPSGG